MSHRLYAECGHRIVTDWPRIRTDVDDDRPAREDEVGYCAHCKKPTLDWELFWHFGERRCKDCLWMCPVCRDAQVSEEGEFCELCALAAMGVDV